MAKYQLVTGKEKAKNDFLDLFLKTLNGILKRKNYDLVWLGNPHYWMFRLTYEGRIGGMTLSIRPISMSYGDTRQGQRGFEISMASDGTIHSDTYPLDMPYPTPQQLSLRDVHSKLINLASKMDSSEKVASLTRAARALEFIPNTRSVSNAQKPYKKK